MNVRNLSDPNRGTNNQEKSDLADVVRALILHTADPSRVLEWHYWAQEPGILEFVRILLMVPPQARVALQAFLAAVDDPKAVSVFVDESGTLNLFSPEAAKVMKTFFSNGTGSNRSTVAN